MSLQTLPQGSKQDNDVRKPSTRAASRKGIFQKISEGLVLHYYTVQSSSDSEGNITLHDVTRHKFDDDLRVMTESSDESDADAVPVDVTAKRYRLRTRRMKKHRDDEFDTMMCGESSDEDMISCSDVNQEFSSDDETYDVTTDNWTYVRCARKSRTPNNHENTKTSKKNSPSKSQKQQTRGRRRSTTKLRDRLRSNLGLKSPVKSANRSAKATPPITSRPKTTTSPKKVQKGKNLLKIVSQLKNSSFRKTVPKSSDNVTSPTSITSLPGISPNIKRLRRCGYNPTFPKIPEIRHIRRRMLKQNPKRAQDDDNSSDDELSATSSGSELSDIGMQKRTTRLRRNNIPPSSTTTTTSNGDTFTTSSCGNSTTPSSGNIPLTRGIKLVIRRQSIESSSPNRLTDTNSKVQKLEFSEGAKKSDKNTETNNKETRLPKSHPTVSDDVTITSSVANDKEIKEIKAELNSFAKDLNQNGGDREQMEGKEEDHGNDDTKETDDVTNKVVKGEDLSKKKKQKKRKKKERGRGSISGPHEEEFVARHTAMRLAMELPRHNWLVNHLIKENKLKAEDAKPLNNSPLGEEHKSGEELGSEVTCQSSTKLETGEAKEETCQVKERNEVEEFEPGIINDADPSTNIEPDSIKTHNNMKASYMVGIVKPFQHLKMFPVNLPKEVAKGEESNMSMFSGDRDPEKDLTTERHSNNETNRENPDAGASESEKGPYNDPVMSPPALFIVDEDFPSQDPGTSKAAKENPSKGNPVAPASNGAQRTNEKKNQNPEVQGLNPGSSTASHTIQLKTTKNPPSTSSNSEFPPPKPPNPPPDKETQPEVSEDVKISNCFSLVLDLSKKPESSDKPLDLSVTVQHKEKSPDVLDLTKKKPTLEETLSLARETVVTKTQKRKSTDDNDVIIIEDNEEIGKPNLRSGFNFPNPIVTHGAKTLQESFVKLTPLNETQGMKFLEGLEEMQPRLQRQISVPVATTQAAAPARRHQSLDHNGSEMRLLTGGQMFHRINNKRPYGVISGPQPRLQPSPSLNTSELEPKRPRIEGFRPSQGQQPPHRQIIKSNIIANGQKINQDSVQKDINPQNVQKNFEFPKLAPKPEGYSRNISEQVLRAQQQVILTTGVVPVSHGKLPSGMPRAVPVSHGNLPSVMPGSVPVSHGKLPAMMPGAAAVNHGKLPTIMPGAVPVSHGKLPPTGLKTNQDGRTPLISTFSTQQVKPHTIPQRPIQTEPSKYRVKQGIGMSQRLPLDVNNNNITSLLPNTSLIPNMNQQRPNLTPKMATSPRIQSIPISNVNTGKPPQPQQSVRVPSSGIPLSRTTPQFPSTNVPVNTLNQVPNSGNKVIKIPDLNNPSPRLIQEQQRIVDEKIQQLEALKRELSMREKNAQQQFGQTLTMPRRAPPAYSTILANQTQTLSQHPIRSQALPVRPLPQPMVPQMRVQAPSSHVLLNQTQSVPVYRNGGLSINRKASLSEPIIIEEDAASSAQSLIARNRHSYSFHPPLSRNRDSLTHSGAKLTSPQHRGRMPAAQLQQTAPRQRVVQINQTPPHRPPSESATEVCIVCGSKSFFLCSGCKKTWYCSKDCQFKDWGNHSKKCAG